jgi:hypothetical protein
MRNGPWVGGGWFFLVAGPVFQCWFVVGEGYRKTALELRRLRTLRNENTSLPGWPQLLSVLNFVVDLVLGKCSDDCRAGDHGHKCEGYQNVVHANAPARILIRAPLPWDTSSISNRRVTLYFTPIGNR